MILLCGIPSEAPIALVREALDEQNQPYVMLNQRKFADMSGCDNRGLGQNIEQPLAIQACFFAQDNRLRDRLHANSKYSVHHQFHRGSRSAGPKMEMLPADRRKNGFCGVKARLIATAKEGQ